MGSWLKGKYKSVQFRILFTFWLIMIVLFTGIGFYLDRVQINTQTQRIEHYLLSQSNIYQNCSNQSQTTLTKRPAACSSIPTAPPHPVNYRLFDQQGALVGEMTQYSSHLDYPSILAHDLDDLRLKNVIQLRISDNFVAMTALKEQVLMMSTASDDFDQQVLNHRISLVCVIFVTLLVLTLGLAWILRNSLKPLARMVSDLEEIATGDAEHLNDEYASEFIAMRDSVNNLLNAERMQRERYRNTLADLAHSLKTPLAVIQGATSEQLDYENYLKVASEQIRRMDQIIQYQLTRAVKSIGDGAKAQPVKLVPIIERILSALGKVYREKEVRVILNLEPNIELSADERDLMEMLGNMLENAYKYCRSEVAVSAYSDSDNVFIVLEDDGPGVSENLRHIILERGERADTSAAPGQGIGLSVSVDILSSYNCRLEVDDSFSLGGAKFSITFPKV